MKAAVDAPRGAGEVMARTNRRKRPYPERFVVLVHFQKALDEAARKIGHARAPWRDVQVRYLHIGNPGKVRAERVAQPDPLCSREGFLCAIEEEGKVGRLVEYMASELPDHSVSGLRSAWCSGQLPPTAIRATITVVLCPSTRVARSTRPPRDSTKSAPTI